MSDFINSTVNTKFYNLMSDEHQIITITDKEAVVENIGTIVSGDTNSCLLTFEINRFQDGIDLSDKKIRFNYKNSNGKFYDIAVNVKYNDDVIRFSWLLPYSLTQPGGNVIASIDFYGYIEYDEQYSYKTKNFKLTVEKSLGVDDGSDESYNNWAIKIENDVEIIQKKISGIEKDIKDIHVPTKLSEMDSDTEYRTVTDSQIDTWNQAQKNVQSDWNETNINSDSYIKHKPTIPKVTNDLTDELKSSYDDAVTNSHVHNNKTVLDNIDDQYIKKWNSAYSHSISSHAPENAQENIIEDIKINGVSTAISDKTVNITIPTKTSDITNDSGFITNITNNLVNYYLKSEVYTKEEVQSLIGRVSSLELIKVDALPTEDIKTSAIYLVPSDQSEENNIYTEYIYMDGQWEIIGDTSVDLSQYALNKDVNEIRGDLGKVSEEIADLPQPDWNQNDQSAADYVKDRPFYSETANVTVENAVDESLDHFPVFAVGDTVTVNVDGVEHSLVAYDDGGDAAIGDTYSSVGDGEGQLGWNIYVSGSDEVCFYATEAHTVSYLGIIHHKLDKKYMPDGVLDTIYEAYGIANNAQSAADNAQNTANNAQSAAKNAQNTADNARSIAKNAQTIADKKPSVVSRSITIYDKIDVLDIQVGETFSVTKEGYITNGIFVKGNIVILSLEISDLDAGRYEAREFIANAVDNYNVSGILNWYDVMNDGVIKVYAVHLKNTPNGSTLSLVRLA